MITSLKIDGNEIINFIKSNGLKYVYRKKTGPNQNESINGTTILDIIATKEDLVLSCRDLTDSEQEALQSFFTADEFEVEYYSKAQKAVIAKRFWISELSSGSKASYPDGSAIWTGIVLQLNAIDPL